MWVGIIQPWGSEKKGQKVWICSLAWAGTFSFFFSGASAPWFSSLQTWQGTFVRGSGSQTFGLRLELSRHHRLPWVCKTYKCLFILAASIITRASSYSECISLASTYPTSTYPSIHPSIHPTGAVFLENTDSSVQLSSAAQSCLTLCDPMDSSVPGLPVHHQLPEFTDSYPETICPSYPSRIRWHIRWCIFLLTTTALSIFLLCGPQLLPWPPNAMCSRLPLTSNQMKSVTRDEPWPTQSSQAAPLTPFLSLHFPFKILLETIAYLALISHRRLIANKKIFFFTCYL